MARFEKVSRFNDIDLPLPVRKTASSAGYDFVVAEDTTVPAYTDLMFMLSRYELFELNDASLTEEEANAKRTELFQKYDRGLTLDELGALTKAAKTKPTLVSTGMKCQLEPDTYLELSVRSSSPLKYWLILANSVGIIDADYYNNPDNEGEIFFQFINLSPYPIILKKGDVIGQGIIKNYLTTDDDCATGERVGGFGSTSKSAINNLQEYLSELA